MPDLTRNLNAERKAIALAHVSPSKFFALGLESDHFAEPGLRKLAEQAAELYRSGDETRILAWARNHSVDASEIAAISSLAPGPPDQLRATLTETRSLRRVEAAARAVLGRMATGVAAAVFEAAQTLPAACDVSGAPGVDLLSEVAIRAGQRMFTKQDRSQWVDPGSPHWVKAVGSFKPGTLTCIAAPTNVGKSQVALHLLECVARRGSGVGGYISLEDPEEVVGQRSLARVSGISPNLQDDVFSLPPAQMREVQAKAGGRLHKRILDDWFGDTLFAARLGAGSRLVEATMLQMAARGARVIVVDYLQEIDASDTGERERLHGISKVVTRLKQAAERHGFALILVSQLSREGGKVGEVGQCPSLHTLKESGDIENKCECVVMCWADASDRNTVHLRVLKSKGRDSKGYTWSMARNPDMGGMLYDIE